MPGSYLITIALYDATGQLFDWYEEVLQVSIEDSGTIFTKYNQNQLVGLVMRPLVWTCVPVA